MNVAGTAKSTLLYRLTRALLHTMKKWFTIDYSIKTGSFKKANSIKEVEKRKVCAILQILEGLTSTTAYTISSLREGNYADGPNFSLVMVCWFNSSTKQLS